MKEIQSPGKYFRAKKSPNKANYWDCYDGLGEWVCAYNSATDCVTMLGCEMPVRLLLDLGKLVDSINLLK